MARLVALAMAVGILVASAASCTNEPGPSACACVGAVPEGRIETGCATTQCIGGALYRCTGPNMAVREADSCGPPPPPPHLRPAGTPDFIIVAVSGHCLFSCPRSFNTEYLYAEGTAMALTRPMLDRGLIVQAVLGTDNLEDEPRGGGAVEANGFISLLEDLETVRDTLVADWDNPTRVIVVAHSHGAVWAHIALHVLEQRGAPLPVDVLVDLDAVSTGWEDKTVLFVGDAWGPQIDAYTARTGTVWPFPISRAADAIRIPGIGAPQDIEDVVPNSVARDLEVWSSDGTSIRDVDHNVRLDGSEREILFFRSAANHEGSHLPGSDAVAWATLEIAARYGW